MEHKHNFEILGTIIEIVLPSEILLVMNEKKTTIFLKNR